MKRKSEATSITSPLVHFSKLMNESNWIDVGRKFFPKDEKLYSWWSYRNKDWKKSNRGRRLDHIWVSKDLDYLLKSFLSCKEIRD